MNKIVHTFTVAFTVAIVSCQRAYAESPVGSSDSERGQTFKDLVMADLRQPFPTDAELRERFTQLRRDFEKLVTMAQEDNEVIRIAPDFTWTTSNMGWPRPQSELGFTLERWNEYRRLFQILGLEAGILRPCDHPNAIYLIVQTKGLSVAGSSKGYAYSEIPLEPHCESLDQDRGSTETGICFKPLGGKWYLYLDWD
ncbi:MAG: hypothetical protein DMF28_08100 [Verrucomicrobia bacterium]|nr:MAG: hypothetical protein DMF28_08100 [Verrucomicrobiota bacterium]